jgi:hypothetical protein
MTDYQALAKRLEESASALERAGFKQQSADASTAAQLARGRAEAPEPVAWMFPRRYGSGLSFVRPADYFDELTESMVTPTPLFTHPPAPQPAAQPQSEPTEAQAARDVLAERRRQIESEGYTPAHDDEYDEGEMARAAACYALSAVGVKGNDIAQLRFWPWADEWWKPSDPRRDLVKAAALILAEIERIDRAALAAKE